MSVLCLNGLEYEVRLGVTAQERAVPQPIRVDIRLYYQDTPPACRDDHSTEFSCYHTIADRLHGFLCGYEGKLLEYLGQELFREVREAVTDDAQVWLRVTKVRTPVEHLTGGVSFVLSDLPVAVSALPVA